MRISDWSSDVCSSDLKPLHHILAGILTLSAGWKPPLVDTFAGHLRRDLDEESLDIGCIADAGWFTKCADSFELNTVDKAATRFLFELIAQLQAIGTAPMLDIRAYASMIRSEERRVGKECVSTCRSLWAPYH